MRAKIFTAGGLLVTGTGDFIIEEVIPKTRAMLVHPHRFVRVCFDPDEPAPPPCAGCSSDELAWEMFFHPVPRHHHQRDHVEPEEELRLRIKWRVSTARTILWEIISPS